MTGERLKEIVTALAQPGWRFEYDRDENSGRLLGPAIQVSSSEAIWLVRQGWAKGFANGGGFWLSDEGRKAFLRSTDELGDGKLPMDIL